VYKLDSFVGFIGDEQLHAQECYVGLVILNKRAWLNPAGPEPGSGDKIAAHD
jgi:hypothetical protein